MLSNFAKNVIRSRIENNLTKTCTVTRYIETVDPVLGIPEKSLQSQTNYACFLTRVGRSGSELVLEADQGRVFYMLQLPYDADIEDGDTVTIDSEDYETKQVFRSQSVDVMRQAMVVKVGS